MMIFIIGLAITTFFHGTPPINNTIPAESWNMKWITSPITYVALNLSLAQSVLVPLASEVRIEKPFLGWDFRWCWTFFNFIIDHLAILSVDRFYQYNIPMAEVIRRFNATFHFFFVLIIFGEVFTTLVGNVFGMTKQMQSITGWKNHILFSSFY